MLVKSVLFSLLLTQFLQISFCNPINSSHLGAVTNSNSASSHVPKSGIDPIKFVLKSTHSNVTNKPEAPTTTTTHSPGLRSLSHAEPELNEVENGQGMASKHKKNHGKLDSNQYDKYLRNPEHDVLGPVYQKGSQSSHSRSKRAIILLLIKKLVKLKFLLLG